jgi:hypothetical protein
MGVVPLGKKTGVGLVCRRYESIFRSGGALVGISQLLNRGQTMGSNKLAGLILVAVALAACSYGPPTAGELKEFDSVCDKANDGKRIAVVGYLRFPDKFTGTQSAVLRLYKEADFKSTPIGVQTSIGSNANQMELPPSRYTDADLNVHLADGQMAGVHTKVKVSGKIYYPIIAQDFTCSLENPLIESGK